VLVALIPLLVQIKSPVLNAPDPAFVFEELVGEILKESPKLITPPLTLLIEIGPTIDGIVNTLYSSILPIAYDKKGEMFD
jgi:hypothetical protein